MGEIKKLQENCIPTFQALSRPVYGLGRGCLPPAWRFPWPAEARQGQLKIIALVTLSQGDPKVEGLETQLVAILPSFLWVRSHAEWICDSLHKHLREWFLASLSHVLKSGLHHHGLWPTRSGCSSSKIPDGSTNQLYPPISNCFAQRDWALSRAYSVSAVIFHWLLSEE